MIELKKPTIDDVLMRTTRVDLVVPPVVPVMGTGQEMFVDQLVLAFRKQNDEPWQEWSVLAIGVRRNKDGSRGKEDKVNRYVSYNANQRPDWLLEIINFFTPES
jgi:hypothetical protein